MDEELPLNEILELLGPFGRYQKRVMVWGAMLNLLCACQTTVPIFSAAAPVILCTKAGKLNATIDCSTLNVEDAYCAIDSSMWEIHHGDRTIVSQWRLICSEEWKVGFITSVFFTGFLIGNGICGSLADLYGRKKVIWYSGLLLVSTAFLSALSPNYWFYIACRACLGLASGGGIATFVLVSESVGDGYRSLVGTIISVCFSAGIMIGAVLAAAIPHWRALTIAGTLPFFVLFGTFTYIYESPSWLLSVGKNQLASNWVTQIQAINRKQATEIPKLRRVAASSPSSTSTISPWTLFSNPVLRSHTFKMLLIWFAVAFAYYGLSFNAGNLGGNLYLSVFLSGLSEIPALIPTQYLMDRKGRRYSLALFLWISVVSYVFCFCIAVPHECEAETKSCWPKTARLISSLVGKGAVSAAFTIVYVVANELFPTIVRSMAMSLFSQSARIGSMLAPVALMAANTSRALPFIIFGIVVASSAIVSHTIPETVGRTPPDTLDELTNDIEMTTLINNTMDSDDPEKA